jgi:hypothetical protein
MFSYVAMAQAKPADDTTPSKEQVLKFLEILRVKSQLTLYFDGVAKEAKLGAEEGFKRKVPDATPAQLAEVDEFAQKLFQGMPIDEMVDAMVPIYQRHLTREDIDNIMAFYSSPVGQKLQREQPAMMQEGMKAGGEIGRRRLQAMMQQMDDFIAKMAQEQKKETKP